MLQKTKHMYQTSSIMSQLDTTFVITRKPRNLSQFLVNQKTNVKHKKNSI